MSTESAFHDIHEGRAHARLVPAPFESSCFGLVMGAVRDADCPESDDGALGHAVLTTALNVGYQHLSARLPAGSIPTIQSLEVAGFRCVDTHVWLARSLDTVDPNSTAGVRQATPADLPFLLKVSQGVFAESRFYCDPSLPSGADKLHATWIENNLRGRSDLFLIATTEAGEAGYISCCRGLDGNPDIDLIAVGASFRGRGVGRSLVEAAMRHYAGNAKQMTVTTQGSNAGALQLYQRCGFRLERVELTLHARVSDFRSAGEK